MPRLADRARVRLTGWEWVVWNLAIGLACYGLEELTLPLALPPGFASPARPAAGVGLAAILLVGPRVWPGIFLGTWAAFVGIAFDPDGSTSLFAQFALTLLMAAGAAAQALAGGGLIRRFSGYPSLLVEASDVTRFLVLGGPVSGLIGATIAALALLLFGPISNSDFAYTWSTWWAASSIGAALFAPLLLLWFPGVVRAGLRRRISVTAPLAMIFSLAVVLYLQVGARESEHLASEFERRADDVGAGIERSLDRSLEVLDSLGGFYDASHRVDRREFSSFARHLLSRSPSVRALAWSPRVKSAERETCVRSAQLEVDPGYAILERDARGTLVPAGEREHHVPTYYVESRGSSSWALGFDAASDPDRRAALWRACEEGREAATPPLPLGEGSETDPGMIVYRPVFGHGERRSTPEERRKALTGYVSAELSIEDIVREGLRRMETEGIAVRVSDVTDDPSGRTLYRSTRRGNGPPPPGSGAWPVHPRTLRHSLGSRVLELRFSPDLEVAMPRHAWQSWFVLAAGLLFTGLLECFLLVVTGRSDAIEELVARRTAELRQANVDLRHEVAERARAEAQHQSSQLRLAAAQQIAHLGSWELDIASGVVLCSDELCRIHGIEPGAPPVRFAEFLERVHSEDREIVALAVDQAIRDRKAFSLHHRLVRPDEEVRVIHARGDVLLDPEGKPVRIHGTGQDVTELKHAERELARRTLELERSNGELERFAYVASHDLQEPLRAVASHVQILEQDYRGRLDEEADECIRRAVEGAKRMHDLINDYLAYSRVRSGSEPLRPTSSVKALDSALKHLSQSIRESSASVTSDELPEVLADEVQLVQLFQNLVGNAVKFHGDEPPRVHVSAARAANTWLFSVRDNGIGIDPEHSGRIFSLFKRLHTQERYPGTGIGLAICKKIIDRHGGRIWVESMPGMGATFRFTLPACVDDAGRAVEAIAPTTVAVAPGIAGLEHAGPEVAEPDLLVSDVDASDVVVMDVVVPEAGPGRRA